MEVEDLNKSQLILLAILLSFVISIATGITTVTLMERAPKAITVPINKVITQTVEKIVPSQNSANFEALSEDQKKLLEELKAIKPLTVSLFLKSSVEGGEDKILGTGLFLGSEKIVIASLIDSPKEGEVYVIKSVLGEQKVNKVTQEKDFTIIELAKTDTTTIDTKVEPKTEVKKDTDTTPVLPATQ